MVSGCRSFHWLVGWRGLSHIVSSPTGFRQEHWVGWTELVGKGLLAGFCLWRGGWGGLGGKVNGFLSLVAKKKEGWGIITIFRVFCKVGVKSFFLRSFSYCSYSRGDFQ